MPAAFEHVEEAGEVGVGVGMRVDQRMAHAGLPREMHDLGKAMDREQVGHALAVGDIHPLEPEIGICPELCNASVLQPGIVVGIEIVDAHHIMPLHRQSTGDMHADEPGCPGDENRLPQDRSFRVERRCGDRIETSPTLTAP